MIKWLFILMIAVAMIPATGELTRLVVEYGEQYGWSVAPF